MKSIIAHYMRGTDFGIGMNDDGLIRAGDRQTPVTWMDARVGGQAVTPRHGCAVDINALWYNAVCFARELGTAFADFPPAIAELPERVGDSFRRAFWIESGMYLADAVSDGVPDPSIRPNQILAVSLPYSPLDAEQAAAVVEQVRAELLTPFGLRTLSPRSGKYQGQYAGNAETRDRAYHQGTVWPWLLGHFGEALLRVSTNEAAARRFLLETLDPLLRDHVLTAGLGCVSEIFDGDPPHHPNGCIAQAWSVSELIRLLCLVNASTATGKTRCAS
jgi:predicted glycogen debranching enzyme